MRTVLVMNSKGGCGKTTLTTNLASYFASQKLGTTIMDYDPQGSSLNWLRLRPQHAPAIYGANAAPRGNGLRSIQMSVPADTETLLIDAPAGVKGLLLQELLNKAQYVVIPVPPSPIDIHATADFIKELLLFGRIRARNIRVAVVANRVRKNAPVYEPLERFLGSLNLPLLARISDSDEYVKAVENGLGVFEMHSAYEEQQEFLPVVQWLERRGEVYQSTKDQKVVGITTARRAQLQLGL